MGLHGTWQGAHTRKSFWRIPWEYLAQDEGGGGTNNLGPRALNIFNDKMANIYGINNVQDLKHGQYSMEIFVR